MAAECARNREDSTGKTPELLPELLVVAVVDVGRCVVAGVRVRVEGLCVRVGGKCESVR